MARATPKLTLMSNIVIDTSTTATDTVQYVATDQSGLTSTSTRTVIIDPAGQGSASINAKRSQFSRFLK